MRIGERNIGVVVNLNKECSDCNMYATVLNGMLGLAFGFTGPNYKVALACWREIFRLWRVHHKETHPDVPSANFDALRIAPDAD